MSVLVAAVAGNSYGIHAAETLPLHFVDKQFEVLLTILKFALVRQACYQMLA